VIHAETGNVSIPLPGRNDFFQQDGFIHGGILSYLANNTITLAGGAVLTAEYQINCLKSAGQFPLIITAEVIQSGKRLAICQYQIYSETNDSSAGSKYLSLSS
jgi:acyl-CoA thioesterase